jgi:hypothetical protein
LTRSYRIAPEVAWRLVEGELFAVTGDGRLHNVRSAVGLHIWSLLVTGADRETLLDAIVANYSVSEEDAGRDLDDFLDSLLDRALIRRV